MGVLKRLALGEACEDMKKQDIEVGSDHLDEGKAAMPGKEPL